MTGVSLCDDEKDDNDHHDYNPDHHRHHRHHLHHHHHHLQVGCIYDRCQLTSDQFTEVASPSDHQRVVMIMIVKMTMMIMDMIMMMIS